jgi:hypothetical protein
MSARPRLRSYRVTVFAWSADTTTIDVAESLWSNDGSMFRRENGGINDVMAEEILP